MEERKRKISGQKYAKWDEERKHDKSPNDDKWLGLPFPSVILTDQQQRTKDAYERYKKAHPDPLPTSCALGEDQITALIIKAMQR